MEGLRAIRDTIDAARSRLAARVRAGHPAPGSRISRPASRYQRRAGAPSGPGGRGRRDRPLPGNAAATSRGRKLEPRHRRACRSGKSARQAVSHGRRRRGRPVADRPRGDPCGRRRASSPATHADRRSGRLAIGRPPPPGSRPAAASWSKCDAGEPLEARRRRHRPAALSPCGRTVRAVAMRGTCRVSRRVSYLRGDRRDRRAPWRLRPQGCHRDSTCATKGFGVTDWHERPDAVD